MTETPAQYDHGLQTCARDGCDVRFRPKHERHRCCSDPCRAAYSRQRKQEGAGPGKIAGCRIIRDGSVSVTVHLPPEHQDRISELATGGWVHVTPHGGR